MTESPDELTYKGVHIDYNTLYSSTQTYAVRQEGYHRYISHPFPVRLLIPDFLLENLIEHSLQERKTLLDFLKIFLVPFLNKDKQLTRISKEFLYKFTLHPKHEKKSIPLFTSKKALWDFFSPWGFASFKIAEHLTFQYRESKMLVLGKPAVKVRDKDQKSRWQQVPARLDARPRPDSTTLSCGTIPLLTGVAVYVTISQSQGALIQDCAKALGKPLRPLLWSSPQLRTTARPQKAEAHGSPLYHYTFLFRDGVCVSVFSGRRVL